jgi:hypothetical protein
LYLDAEKSRFDKGRLIIIQPEKIGINKYAENIILSLDEYNIDNDIDYEYIILAQYRVDSVNLGENIKKSGWARILFNKISGHPDDVFILRTKITKSGKNGMGLKKDSKLWLCLGVFSKKSGKWNFYKQQLCTVFKCLSKKRKYSEKEEENQEDEKNEKNEKNGKNERNERNERNENNGRNEGNRKNEKNKKKKSHQQKFLSSHSLELEKSSGQRINRKSIAPTLLQNSCSIVSVSNSSSRHRAAFNGSTIPIQNSNQINTAIDIKQPESMNTTTTTTTPTTTIITTVETIKSEKLDSDTNISYNAGGARTSWLRHDVGEAHTSSWQSPDDPSEDRGFATTPELSSDWTSSQSHDYSNISNLLEKQPLLMRDLEKPNPLTHKDMLYHCEVLNTINPPSTTTSYYDTVNSNQQKEESFQKKNIFNLIEPLKAVSLWQNQLEVQTFGLQSESAQSAEAVLTQSAKSDKEIITNLTYQIRKLEKNLEHEIKSRITDYQVLYEWFQSENNNTQKALIQQIDYLKRNNDIIAKQLEIEINVKIYLTQIIEDLQKKQKR